MTGWPDDQTSLQTFHGLSRSEGLRQLQSEPEILAKLRGNVASLEGSGEI